MERRGAISRLNRCAQNTPILHAEAWMHITQAIICDGTNRNSLMRKKNHGGAMGMVFVTGISPRNILPA